MGILLVIDSPTRLIIFSMSKRLGGTFPDRVLFLFGVSWAWRNWDISPAKKDSCTAFWNGTSPSSSLKFSKSSDPRLDLVTWHKNEGNGLTYIETVRVHGTAETWPDKRSPHQGPSGRVSFRQSFTLLPRHLCFRFIFLKGVGLVVIPMSNESVVLSRRWEIGFYLYK